MEEIGYKHFKGVFLFFCIVLGFISVLYSCSTQRSLADNTKYIYVQDTIIVPKALRPSTLAKQQVPPLKMPTEEQKQFNQKLNYVLDNAGARFNDISSIRGDISDLRNIILERAVFLRNSNDSLTRAILYIKQQQIDALTLARSESKARIEYEKKTQEAQSQNKANYKALNLYTSLLFSFLVVMLIVLLLQWWDLRRIKTKYKQQLDHA